MRSYIPVIVLGLFISQNHAYAQDASSSTVTTSDGGRPRTLATRFDEEVNILDYGAACDGSTNDYGALFQAQLVGQRRGGATIKIPSGCKLNLGGGMVYTISQNGWDFGANTNVDSGNLESLTDSLQNSTKAFAKSSSNQGNESDLFISSLFKPSGSYSNQKNGIYNRTVQEDDSSYKTVAGVDDSIYSRDAVGIESQTILANVQSGRGWAYHGAVEAVPNSDGQLIAAEFEVYNMSSFVDKVQNRFNKKGIHVDAMGSYDSNEAVDVSGVSHWKDAFVVEQGSLRPDGHALILRRAGSSSTNDAVASINYDGSAELNGIVSNGPIVLTAGPALIVEFAAQGAGQGQVPITTYGGLETKSNNLGLLQSGAQTMKMDLVCVNSADEQEEWSIIHQISYQNGRIYNQPGIINSVGTKGLFWSVNIKPSSITSADSVTVTTNERVSCSASVKLIRVAH